MRNITIINLRKYLPLLFLTCFLVNPEPVDAGVISVNPEGRIMIKVLSAETSAIWDEGGGSSVNVSKVKGVGLPDPSISLVKKDGKVSMTVLSEGTTQELDVTDLKEDVVEIDERPEVRKLTVSVLDSGFALNQGSFSAHTGYPVEIDAKNARLSLVTARGKEFLSVFPLEAVESALRSGIISKIDKDIEIQDTEKGLNYLVNGQKVFNILGLTEYQLPVSVSVSSIDGRILSVDSSSPVYRVLKVLFI